MNGLEKSLARVFEFAKAQCIPCRHLAPWKRRKRGRMKACTAHNNYKASGYDSQHSDWFWMKCLADGTAEVEGRVEGCRCHGMVLSHIRIN
jgi:hypothetical protein